MNAITVTNNVDQIFQNIFPKTHKVIKKIKKNCGLCDGCTNTNCGSCIICKKMNQFGGTGVSSKEICIRRKCKNSDENNDKLMNTKEPVLPFYLKRKFSWGMKKKIIGTKILYSEVTVDNVLYKVGDFVFCQGSSDIVPAILRIEYMWVDIGESSIGFFHGSVFYRSDETILGPIGNSQDIYLVDNCYDNCPITVISSKANVVILNTKNVFSKKRNANCLYLSKYYNIHNATFEDLPTEFKCITVMLEEYCNSCFRKRKLYLQLLPVLGKSVIENMDSLYESVDYKGETIKLGSGVFIYPNTETSQFGKKSESTKAVYSSECSDIISTYDENVFTEIHKFTNHPTEKMIEPLKIGIVKSIIKENGIIKLIVFKVKRPEEIFEIQVGCDFSKVYITNEQISILITETAGLCNVVHRKYIPADISLTEWTNRDSKNFYFDECLKNSRTITKIPNAIMNFIENHNTAKFIEAIPTKINFPGQYLQSDVCVKSHKKRNLPYSRPNVKKSLRIESMKSVPLKMMDIFAGCGGLSKGLEDSGFAVSFWAIENSETASESYKVNFPHCSVFNEDCNDFLKKAINKEKKINNKNIPQPGEVDVICGGPPCQGWTGINRFATSDFSKYQNSLLATFLSFCDFYRPKYIIFENVKRFAIAKRGVVLKLTLKCLLELGYQCTAIVVDCGAFGVPQKRKRVIIFGAIPGVKLPHFPKPTNSFDFSFEEDTVVENDFETYSKNLCSGPAPRRRITLSDAISDLPSISPCHNTPVKYECKPKNDFQVQIRGSSTLLFDHVCKPISSLSEARIKYIPKHITNADWRFLPNIPLKLPNGIKLKKLQYTHYKNSSNKGVCPCFFNKNCDPQFKQRNTLIPWGYVHSAARHGNWPGVYGRLDWNSYCNTILSNPDPSRIHGRTIHPSEDRILSVRENARIMGFPDDFCICGSIEEKYKQIANAVPIPLALAIGREFVNSWKSNSPEKHCISKRFFI